MLFGISQYINFFKNQIYLWKFPAEFCFPVNLNTPSLSVSCFDCQPTQIKQQNRGSSEGSRKLKLTTGVAGVACRKQNLKQKENGIDYNSPILII